MRPYKVLLFICACMVCLGALCVVLPERVSIWGYTLRWPTLAQIAGTAETDTEEAIEEAPVETPVEAPEEVIEQPADTIQSVSIPEKKPSIPVISVDSTTDSRIFLWSFYQSLTEAGHRKVRVVHYGDSQIEEDRMTDQIRHRLQDRYGGTGAGLLPLVQTIPTRTVHQELQMSGKAIPPQQGPRRYLVYGPKRDQRSDGLYGVMGQMACMNDSIVKGSEALTVICTPTDGRPHYDTMRVFADSSIHYEQEGDTLYLSGRGNVYALSQESTTGVIVDNIPMRGCLGLVFTKMDSAQLSQFYAEENVQLIILQFGGNAIPFNETPSTIQAVVRGLRKQVRYIRQCAPEASILFIGPSDMLRQTDGEWQTYPMVPYMDKLLRQMALNEQIAYFSLYEWMGGSGSMLRWRESGLAGSDGVHFYRSGARKAGRAVAEWLLTYPELSPSEVIEEQSPQTNEP